MLQIYFAAGAQRWPNYQPHLTAALAEADIKARVFTECADPASVDYIIMAPDSDVSDFSPFVRTKAVLNIWAGVEKITGNPTLNQPLCRMVDPGLTAAMVEWVSGQVLRHHLGMDRYIINPDHQWVPHCPPLASERRVTILGLGALGQAVAHTLLHIGFDVAGWSRSPRSVPGVACFDGAGGLAQALRRAEILILLLPATAATENTLGAAELALMPPGAVIINPGRGPLIDDDALLAALDTGHIDHATLDVFRTEPLPHGHPYWAHPRVTVTPHVAAETRPASASRCLVENIQRGERGEPFLHRVDRQQGY